MNNAEQYHFADFTRENYRRLLGLMKKAYPICTYEDVDQLDDFLILRHDVDFSMHAAVKIARIEQEEKVASTYFVYFHSEFYNLLEKSVSDKLCEIVELGHQIGLHFDSHYFDISSESLLLEHLHREKKYLESIINREVKVFSFHRTSPFTLSCVQEYYADMRNVYSKFFKEQVGYCSDSNGYWRHRRLEEVLAQTLERKLQVLTHPAWWQDWIMSPKERVERCISGRAESTKRTYAEVLLASNREEIDWKKSAQLN